jgi:hypothetical protein
MRITIMSTAEVMYLTGVNYKVGDEIVSKEHPEKVIGVCTKIENGCIFIDGKNHGGKYFFMKSEWQEPEIL